MRRSKGSYTSWQVVILALIAALAMACDVEAEGEEGNFTFRYVQSEATTASDIAVGATLTLEVIDAEANESVTVDEAYAEAPDVFEVGAPDGSRFSVQALQAGTSRITAESGELSDSFELRAAEATALTLESVCSSEQYFTDGRAMVRFRMEDDAQNRLTGYGYYPVAFEPEGGGEIDESYQRLDFLRFSTGSDAGEYELTTELAGESLAFSLVDIADVDELDTTFEEDTTVTTIDVDEVRTIAPFSLKVGDDEICGDPQDNLVITSQTPEICEARYGREFENVATLLDLHLVEVEGVDSGLCEISIEVPDAGLDAQFAVEVR